MPYVGRRMKASGAFAILLMLYFACTWSPSSHQSARSRNRMSAEERLRTFSEPQFQLKKPLEAIRSGASKAEELVRNVNSDSAEPLNPFPFDGLDTERMRRVKGKGIFDGAKVGLGGKGAAADKSREHSPANARPEGRPPAADDGPSADQAARLRPDDRAQKFVDTSVPAAPKPDRPLTGSSSPATNEQAEEKKEGENKEGEEAAAADGNWNSVVFDFQRPRKFAQPKTDLAEFAHLRAHNYNAGAQNRTIATYVCTRGGSFDDPYFAAAQQLIYRALWDPKSASDKYPFTVFVAPHISEEQRAQLRGAGAIVRELDLVEWNPGAAVFSRWRDLFSKLHMWNQTDFSSIAFLDSDAFPVQNIDDIFSKASGQTCEPSLLEAEDRPSEAQICPYTFSGVPIGGSGDVNVGVMVLSPNPAMHARLMRNYMRLDMYDNNYAEQAFLNWQFSHEGPFPSEHLDRAYNGYFPQPDEEHKLKIVHEKLWAFHGEETPKWTRSLFEDNWREMLEFYDSPSFRAARLRDGT